MFNARSTMVVMVVCVAMGCSVIAGERATRGRRHTTKSMSFSVSSDTVARHHTLPIGTPIRPKKIIVTSSKTNIAALEEQLRTVSVERDALKAVLAEQEKSAARSSSGDSDGDTVIKTLRRELAGAKKRLLDVHTQRAQSIVTISVLERQNKELQDTIAKQNAEILRLKRQQPLCVLGICCCMRPRSGPHIIMEKP